jgi:hypothetical protein
MTVEPIDSEAPVVNYRGRIEGLTTQFVVSVRLLGVFAPVVREAKVDPDGRFDLDAIPPGEYILLVLSQSQVLHLRRVAVYMSEDEIDLKITLNQYNQLGNLAVPE